jgi:hypothetical protein
MSRIRSVHPGFFRDENLVPCSSFARLLYIGLGVEADDKGIFEWKPLQLKMTIFPADGVDVGELLAELVAAGNVKRFEVGGKAFGAIRNFRKYQRPKTPNDVHPMPDDIAEYVAFPRKAETEAGEPAPFPPEGEKSPQMEDGGWRVEEKNTSPPPVLESEGARVSFEDVLEAYPENPSASETKARAEFERTKPADRPVILAAAIRTSKWLAQDSAERGRSVDEGLRFVTHLATWLKEGKWRDAANLPLKGEKSSAPTIPMMRIDRTKDEALWNECERIGGKAPTSDFSWAFKAEIVQQARANLQTQESVH